VRRGATLFCTDDVGAWVKLRLNEIHVEQIGIDEACDGLYMTVLITDVSLCPSLLFGPLLYMLSG